MAPLRFVTLNPGHFHAALVQKEMYPDVEPRVHVYAPLGNDLLAHLQRIVNFNTRPTDPTRWQLEVHTSDEPLQRLLEDKAGDVVILAGRNSTKVDAVQAAVGAGLHVLADKPWILVPENLPKVQAVLDEADRKGLIAYDIMTERYEITSMLQRELVQTPDVFGAAVTSKDEPAVFIESVHNLKKLVAGQPLRRPAWFFDVNQQGEGLSDVGTHLVDLVMWVLFPNQAMTSEDHRILVAERWPTVLTKAEFQTVTGEADFTDFLRPLLDHDKLPYFCNTRVAYQIRGLDVQLDVLWHYEAVPGGGDLHFAVFRGSRSAIEIRQGQEENFRPEVYVVPRSDAAGVRKALAQRIEQLQPIYPGIAMADQGKRFQITIPDSYRVGHEAHFAQVTQQFLRYVFRKETLPTWEKPNMLAKYAVTTGGVARAK